MCVCVVEDVYEGVVMRPQRCIKQADKQASTTDPYLGVERDDEDGAAVAPQRVPQDRRHDTVGTGRWAMDGWD